MDPFAKRGIAYFNKGDYGHAIEQFRSAINNDSNNALHRRNIWILKNI
jgi:tetratricopeptide (TPR) repeat protein